MIGHGNPITEAIQYWQAEVAGRRVRYPVASDEAGLDFISVQQELKTVETFLNELQRSEIPDAIRNPILKDLRAWKDPLQRASTEKVQFCILLMHGNSTSGHEWDVRKGSAF